MAEETLNLKDIPSTPSKILEKYQRAIAKEMEKRAGEEGPKEPLAIYNALYRHPEDEELTWRAGHGERPSWLMKALEEGWTMEAMRVKEETAQAPPISP
jgi:hypothetical protein